MAALKSLALPLLLIFMDVITTSLQVPSAQVRETYDITDRHNIKSPQQNTLEKSTSTYKAIAASNIPPFYKNLFLNNQTSKDFQEFLNNDNKSGKRTVKITYKKRSKPRQIKIDTGKLDFKILNKTMKNKNMYIDWSSHGNGSGLYKHLLKYEDASTEVPTYENRIGASLESMEYQHDSMTPNDIVNIVPIEISKNSHERNNNSFAEFSNSSRKDNSYSFARHFNSHSKSTEEPDVAYNNDYFQENLEDRKESVVTYGGSPEHVYSGPENISTDNPVVDKDIPRIRPEALLETKCPYASTLLQLLNILLEFLNYSSELEKVNKVLTFMETYLESVPASHERDALFLKLKLIEHQLLHNERPHDFFTPDTLTHLEQSKTTIVFKNDIPNISQPNCKEEFARLLQTAYNAYNEVAKFPNCQNNGYPSNDGLFFNNVHSINPKKPYQFDINYHNSPPPKTDDQLVNNDGFNMQYTNLPISPNPYLNLYSFWSNLPGNNLKLPNQPENNPFNFDKSPQINSNLLDAWNTLQNNPLQNTDLINYLPEKPNNQNPNFNLPYYYDSSSQNYLPNPYYPYIPEGGTTIQPKEVEPTPGYDNIKKPYVDNAFYTNIKDPKEELNLPGHGVSVDKVPSNLEAVLKLLSSPNDLYSNLEKLQNTNDIDYSVLLSQLGIPLPPNKINYQPEHTHPNIHESGPTQDYNNMFTGPPGSNNFPGGELIKNKNPFLIQQEFNPRLSDINGLVNGNDNSKETIIDKMSIPFQYDKVTVNHDTIPYILEYIASSKKLPYQNNNINDGFLKGNQFDNYGTLVSNNAFQKPISTDLQRLYDGMANLGKLPNKAGLIELTYVLKRPKPVVYNPVYYVKYRLPYSTFVQNYKTLFANRPVLRSESDQFKFYHELLSLSNVTEVSPDLQGYGKEDIFKLVFDNGALVKAKLVNGDDKYLNEQLQIIQGLNSNSTPEDISRLLNATLGGTDSATDRKQLYSEPFPTAPRPTANVDAGVSSDNKSWPFLSLGKDPSGPLLNLVNVPISLPDKAITQKNPYRPVNQNNNAFVPPQHPKNNAFVLPQHPNKYDYLSHINWKDGSLVPPSYSNNNPYSPSMNTNNSPYAPSINPNNSPYVSSMNLNNSPYPPFIKPKNSPYALTLQSNSKTVAPPTNYNYNALNRPKFAFPKVGYNQQVNGK